MALPPPQPIPASPSPNEHAIPLAPSTPAPHRARLTSLEGQIAQLIAQRQSAERRHRAEVAELKGLLAEARGRAEEGEGEVGRCRREGEHMRQELLDDHGLYAQRAQLALLAEQLTAEGLREEVRTLQIHSSTSFLAEKGDLARRPELDSRPPRLSAPLSDPGHLRLTT
jgi:regulator of protease activity HflC (stomatin/prohibitin superfamily)